MLGNWPSSAHCRILLSRPLSFHMVKRCASGARRCQSCISCLIMGSSAIAQVMIDGALFYAERLSDFEHSQALLFQGPRARRRGFGRARPASDVDAPFSGQGNAGGLTLLGVLQFDFGNTEQQT